METYHIVQNPTPEYAAKRQEHIEKWRELNPKLKDTAEWQALSQAACKAQPRLMQVVLDAYAGSIQGPDGEMCDTFERALYWCCTDMGLTIPEVSKDPQASFAKSLANEGKRQAQADFKIRYQAYLDACRDRKARITYARQECEVAVQAARGRLRDAEAEPLPDEPTKPQ
jgi:hypothetical protein